MNEHATKSLRKKPNNSISVGFNALKNKEIDVFSSAGNSGAMLVGSMFSIGPIKGVIRPSITSILPMSQRRMIDNDRSMSVVCKQFLQGVKM